MSRAGQTSLSPTAWPSPRTGFVFESIHRALQASLPETSSQIVYDTYDLVDSIVSIPSATHPLMPVYSHP